MTDEATSQPVSASIEVVQPVGSPKPYDDVLLDAYEAESKAEIEPTTEAVDAQSQEGEKEPEAKPEQDAEEAKEAPKEEAAKAKAGDKVDDGLENLAVKRLVNGKEIEFKIKDAIQSHLKQEEFNRNMDRRLAVADAKEKKWIQETNQFQDRVKQVIDVAQKGDFVTAIRALAKVAVGNTGLDVTEFERQYFEQLEKVGEVYTKLTPEQREAYFAKRAAAEAKAEADKLKLEKTTAVATSQLEQQVNSLQQEHGLTNDEFWGNYKYLEANLVGEDKPFKSPAEIQPEDVVQYSLRVKHEEKVLQAGKKVGIDNDSILDEVSRITLADPTLTVDDIVSIIESSGMATNANPKAVENLNRKAEKSKARLNSSASSTKKENEKLKDYDEESLNFLYRKQPRVYARPVR